MAKYFSIIIMCLSALCSLAGDKTIGVFVALADNQSQGIVPVPKAIGDGDDPEKNLYWGTADGLKGVFDRSKEWKLTEERDADSGGEVLRTRVYRNANKAAVLTAMAYKGSAIKQCIESFELAVASGAYDMVVFIGHNGLMDFDLPEPRKSDKQVKSPDCIVLCCKSESYFMSRIESAGGRPVLLTTQLMYPGAFILHAAVGSWLEGKDRNAIRAAAGDAYADNQKISKKAGLGVFAVLKEPGKQLKKSDSPKSDK